MLGSTGTSSRPGAGRAHHPLTRSRSLAYDARTSGVAGASTTVPAGRGHSGGEAVPARAQAEQRAERGHVERRPVRVRHPGRCQREDPLGATPAEQLDAGDGTPTVSRSEAQRQIVAATVAFMNAL